MSPAEGSGLLLAVGLLIALAAAVLLQPARRPLDRAPGSRRTGRRAPSASPDIGLLLIEVTTLLRAGATTQRAWERALERAGLAGSAPADDGVPPALLSLAEPPGDWLPRRSAGSWRWDPPLPGRSAERRRRLAASAAVPGAVAACRLTAALGAPLAGILESVAAGVVESGHAEDSRRTALSGPRSTARILGTLPFAGLLLGAAVGARPEDVLLDGAWGSALGALGLALVVAGHALTARLVRAATLADGGVDEALVLDLGGAALASGASLPGALIALGAALEEEQLAVVGRALLLGAGWEEAWAAPEDAAWCGRRSRLERALRPGWEDGASPAPLLAGTAAALRAGRKADDEAAAERLAVQLVLPLGLCHLPAFVILGIVPVIASVGLGLLHG